MKIKMHFLLILIAIPVVFSEDLIDYCTIASCDPGEHTRCKYNYTEVAWDKCGQVISYNLTKIEQLGILDLHNYFRERVYGGFEGRGVGGRQPACRGSPRLRWDEEIAKSAKAWVQQCPDEIDECRDDLAFEVNQFFGKSRGATLEELSIDRILWSWYNEVERFDVRLVSKFSEREVFGSRTNHYTQLVWEDTEALGCAKIIFYDGTEYILLLVCNYGPSGNENGYPVYTTIHSRN